jgi:glycosyltransferase involved in cell wall biosynthesis
VVGIDGETGLLVAPDDPGALAGAIALLLDDPELRARLGAAGRERVMSRFTWQITAAGTAACYEAVMAGEPLPGAPAAAAHEGTPMARGAA